MIEGIYENSTTNIIFLVKDLISSPWDRKQDKDVTTATII